jgi:hypothetical protein
MEKLNPTFTFMRCITHFSKLIEPYMLNCFKYKTLVYNELQKDRFKTTLLNYDKKFEKFFNELKVKYENQC